MNHKVGIYKTSFLNFRIIDLTFVNQRNAVSFMVGLKEFYRK